MTINTINTKLIQNQYHLFIFYGFFFLVIVSFLGNSHAAVYYVLYNKTNSIILVFWKFLFLFCCVIHTFRPIFGENFVIFIYQSKLFDYSKKKIQNIYNFINFYPLVSLFLFQFYVCLFILHLFMLLIGELDIYIEIPYQFLIILRNFLIMPPLIFLYIEKSLFLPSQLRGGWPTGDDLQSLETYAKQAANKLITFAKKNPKVSGGMAVGTLALGAVIGTGASVKSRMSAIAEGSGINTGVLEQTPAVFAGEKGNLDPEKFALFQQLLRYQIKQQDSNLIVGRDTIIDWLKGNPSELEKYRETVEKLSMERLKLFFKQHQEQEALRHAESLMGSPSSQPLLGPEKDTALSGSTSVIPKSALEKMTDFF